MTLASEIYLDTAQVLNLVALTREEIGRARIYVQLNQIYGTITPEMQKVVAGVKEVIFGDVQGDPLVPDQPFAAQAQTYQSPLAE